MPNLKGAVQIFPSDITSIDTQQNFSLGVIGVDDKGNAYRYVQNVNGGSTWAVGKVLMPAAATVVAATVSSDTAKTTITAAAATWTAGQWSGYYCFVSNGGAEGDLKVIKGNDATHLFLETALSAALNGTSALSLFNPFVCDLATASGQVDPVGIAMSAVPASVTSTGTFSGGWVQIEGVAPVISTAGAMTSGKNATTGGATTAGQAVLGITAQGPYDATNIGVVLGTVGTSANKAQPVHLKGVR